MAGHDRINAPAQDHAVAIDDVWVERARRDPAGFATLYDRYAESIYRYCYHRLWDRHQAEDATSATFVRAMASLSNYRAGSFRGWLFGIAHHVTSDHLRARPPTAPLTAASGLAALDPLPEEAALAAEAESIVRGYLQSLTEEQRKVVELRMAGLTGPEIAQALGLSLTAVKSVQFRAYARLRALVLREEEQVADGTR